MSGLNLFTIETKRKIEFIISTLPVIQSSAVQSKQKQIEILWILIIHVGLELFYDYEFITRVFTI